MKLIANECANCRRPLGYVTFQALLIPSFCVLCAGDSDVMEEWGHKIASSEKSIRDVLLDYRFTLNRMDLDPIKTKGK